MVGTQDVVSLQRMEAPTGCGKGEHWKAEQISWRGERRGSAGSLAIGEVRTVRERRKVAVRKSRDFMFSEMESIC